MPWCGATGSGLAAHHEKFDDRSKRGRDMAGAVRPVNSPRPAERGRDRFRCAARLEVDGVVDDLTL